MSVGTPARIAVVKRWATREGWEEVQLFGPRYDQDPWIDLQPPMCCCLSAGHFTLLKCVASFVKYGQLYLPCLQGVMRTKGGVQKSILTTAACIVSSRE